jgi:hypothetical protein
MPYLSTSGQLGESWTFNSPNLLKFGIDDTNYKSNDANALIYT